MQRRNGLFVLSLVAVLLSACLASREPVSQSDGSRELYVTVWANTKCVNAGDTLIARATVVNNHSQPKVIELADRPVFDLYLGYRGDSGSVLIRWSDGKPLNLDLTRIELKPGGSKNLEINWIVPNPAPSTVGVSARFIEDARDVDHPLSPYITVYGPLACPGAFGP